MSRNVSFSVCSTRRTQLTRASLPITNHQSPAYTYFITSSLTYGLCCLGVSFNTRHYIALLPSHTARQVRGFECRDFGFDMHIVTALTTTHQEQTKTTWPDCTTTHLSQGAVPAASSSRTAQWRAPSRYRPQTSALRGSAELQVSGVCLSTQGPLLGRGAAQMAPRRAWRDRALGRWNVNSTSLYS